MCLVFRQSKPKPESKMELFSCPDCGWSVKSPLGEKDILEHVDLHVRNHHPEAVAQVKREDLVNMIEVA